MQSRGLMEDLQQDYEQFSSPGLSPLYRENQFEAVGKNFKMEHFDQIKQKFWKITKDLTRRRFHISQFRVFELIDSLYYKQVSIINKKMQEDSKALREKQLGPLSFFASLNPSICPSPGGEIDLL